MMNTNPPSTGNQFVLLSSAAAQTHCSIGLLWDRIPGVRTYELFIDGQFIATTTWGCHTADGLSPGRQYSIEVRAILKTGEVRKSKIIQVATRPEPRILSITDFGAAGDGQALNTQAIQSAIDACAPGGMVRIPRGVFLSGAIYLKSEMTLQLEEGAVLLGSPHTKDYPLLTYRWEGRERICYSSLINTRVVDGSRLRNITIAGPGKIDANGSALRKAELSELAGAPGRAICIRNTDNLYLHGIEVRQSPAWCVHLIYCNGVSVNDVSIHTRYDESGNRYDGIANGDGLNPDSCRDVYIFNCHIASQDDCIAIKSGRDEEGRAVGIPSENIRISHCRFTFGFGVAVGSEMSGGVRNVLVEDCTFENTFSIAAVKAPRGRGSVIENITYRNCTMINRDQEHHDCQWFRGGLYVDNFYSKVEFDPAGTEPRGEGTPLIRNIRFQNITLDTVGGNAIYLTGLPESPLENIHLENVTAVGKHGFIANNIRGLTLDRVSVEAREGTAMRFSNVR